MKFINDLNKAGVDARTHLLDFSTLILEIMDFGHETSDAFEEWYFNRQNKLIENIDPKNDKELLRQAFNFYVDLEVKKRELKRIQQSTSPECKNS